MKIARLVVMHVEYMSKKQDMQDGILYVSDRFKLAIHLCACGCGWETVTPIEPATGWTLTDGPTLRPSIGNQHWPCGSHYYVTEGRVEPC